jgi:hypothetical protein
MPQVLSDIATFINRWPGTPNVWRRFRVALSPDEVDQCRTFFRTDNGREFIYAIRGVPILVEIHPESPLIQLERLEAWTND